MRNQSGDGIVCDYCGSEDKLDFTYYSYDFEQVDVVNGLARPHGRVGLSTDLCSDCMEVFRERVRMASRPPTPGLLRCDISGADITGKSFTYYKCPITEAVVVLSNRPYCCSKCNKTRRPEDGPCCEDSHLIRSAEVRTDDKYLELNFSQDMFQKFVEHIEQTRKGQNV